MSSIIRNLFINKFCKKKSAEAFKATEKVASDLVLGGGIAGYSGFLHQIQLSSHDLDAIWHNMWRKWKNSNVSVQVQPTVDTYHSKTATPGNFCTNDKSAQLLNTIGVTR